MKLIITLFFVVFFCVVSSCKKRKEKNIQVSKDYALFQNNLATVLPLIIHTSQSKLYLNNVLAHQADTLNSCANYVLINGDTSASSSNIEPIVYSIGFNNCVDKDGFIKNGTITCILNEYLHSIGGSVRVVFSDFVVSSCLINGNIHISKVSNGVYNVGMSNFYLTKNGKRFSYDAFLTYKIEINHSLGYLYDDYLMVNDKGSFTNQFGKKYTVLNNSITRYMSCGYFSKGKIELVDEKNVTQVLDYGDGSCNENYTVIYGDAVFSAKID